MNERWKQCVVGMKGRDGSVRAMPVKGTDMATLKLVVNEHVDPAAMVYTDEFSGYNHIPHHRETVCHSAGEYVRGRHTPTALSPSGHYSSVPVLAPITGGASATASAMWLNTSIARTPWDSMAFWRLAAC